MIMQCCECRKVREGDQWVAPEDSFPIDERVSHGFCPPCAKRAMREVDAYFSSRDGNSTLATD